MIGRNKLQLNEGTMRQIIQAWLNDSTKSGFNAGLKVTGVTPRGQGTPEGGWFEVCLESSETSIPPGPAGDPVRLPPPWEGPV